MGDISEAEACAVERKAPLISRTEQLGGGGVIDLDYSRHKKYLLDNLDCPVVEARVQICFPQRVSFLLIAI